MENDNKKLRNSILIHWGIDISYANNIKCTKVGADWIVEKLTNTPEKRLIAGGILLIVPEEGDAFQVGNSFVSMDGGVNYDYSFEILNNVKEKIKCAKIIAEYIDLSSVQIFSYLSGAPSLVGTFYIQRPLKLLNDLLKYDLFIRLKRPDNLGGYNLEGVS